MIKTGNRGNIIEVTYDNPTTSIILDGEKVQDQGAPLTIPIQRQYWKSYPEQSAKTQKRRGGR